MTVWVFKCVLTLCATSLPRLDLRISAIHNHLATANLTQTHREQLSSHLAVLMRDRYFLLEGIKNEP